MNFIIFSLVYGPLWLLTWLPLPVLYLLSDFFAFLILYIVPYRKKILYKNLLNSFPDKSKSEIKRLANRNIRFFCDSFIESLASIHMTEKVMNKRYRFKNPELLEKIHARGKDIMLLTGHYGNWEWFNLIPKYSPYNVIAVYKILNNKYFDRLFIRLRSKYGVIPVSRQDTLRTILKYQSEGESIMVYSLADQRPRGVQIQHWITFMKQDTPVVLGPEKIARKYNMAVFFYKVTRVGRGYYECEFVPLEEDIASTESPVITKRYYHMLEQHITRYPEYYLWTHNRWKHKRNV